MNVKRAMERYEDLQIALYKPTLKMRVLSKVMNLGRKKGLLPPGFRKTMDNVDKRLPEMTSGLGVIVGDYQKFYPVKQIKENGGNVFDTIKGQEIHIQLQPEDGIPYATSSNQNPDLMQLFTRWYGFSLTYPSCKIYERT